MQAFQQFKRIFQDNGARREHRLLVAARAGDSRAFDTLITEQEATLRRYISSRVGKDNQDDVLQETRLAAWVTLSSFAGRSRFRAWLLGIAYHKCQDCHRGRQGALRREVALDHAILERADPQDSFAISDARILVRELLEQLPQAQREVMELYYYGGLTLVETAQVLGRGVNTVKSQFYRAHSRAVEILDPETGETLSLWQRLSAPEKLAP